ncbi:NAD(P)H-dependent oxidoreductase [Flavihumibacter sp. RY-1]|uniref:NAD(P)H-dependent oxidoreductase n=1 Tax=Flavihumibacter fluminis TaxID=2909236 RepID=A0ABS9BK31_9BACT|nr:NAD(P)H-dependent oxidoreductase [Flavihumibacter fluminis]MBU7578382.1 NAD(P)H-dependent oxidoreductase [Flavihumibacter sp.]MCF1715907.1 NAD(P)H-dependent oxidoreductase [Flavihumibacter fluminis]
MHYLEQLNWRYATKRYNGEPVPETKLQNILEAIKLAPSSLGLQPFEVLVIEDPELREKLAPAAYNQPAITESGALLVFTVWKNITNDQVDAYIDQMARIRQVPVESLDGFKNMILANTEGKSAADLFQWNARQAYIALGYATAAAALEKIDSTPMEGFNPEKVNEILGLDENGTSAVLLLALGFRDEEKDPLAKLPKVRREVSLRELSFNMN